MMPLLDAKSLHMKRALEAMSTSSPGRIRGQLEAMATKKDLNESYRRIGTMTANMNVGKEIGEADQPESQLAQQVRNATSNLERAEVLRDKLYQLIDRLRGPVPQPAPEQDTKLADQGAMSRLVMQHERTSETIETALHTLNEIEKYV